MAINAPVIIGSDPGAVPGGSTNTPFVAGRWGRNRIDERLKGFCFVPVRYHRYRSAKYSCQ